MPHSAHRAHRSSDTSHGYDGGWCIERRSCTSGNYGWASVIFPLAFTTHATVFSSVFAVRDRMLGVRTQVRVHDVQSTPNTHTLCGQHDVRCQQWRAHTRTSASRTRRSMHTIEMRSPVASRRYAHVARRPTRARLAKIQPSSDASAASHQLDKGRHHLHLCDAPGAYPWSPRQAVAAPGRAA